MQFQTYCHTATVLYLYHYKMLLYIIINFIYTSIQTVSNIIYHMQHYYKALSITLIIAPLPPLIFSDWHHIHKTRCTTTDTVDSAAANLH